MEQTIMDDQLKVLIDYTKFHIGLYTTLCTILIGVIGLEGIKGHARAIIPYLLGTLICFVIAGFFGGIVGSSLPYYTTWTAFTGAKLGPWFWPDMMPALWVASAEHAAFWVGIIFALWGVIKSYVASAPT